MTVYKNMIIKNCDYDSTTPHFLPEVPSKSKMAVCTFWRGHGAAGKHPKIPPFVQHKVLYWEVSHKEV